MKRSTVKRSSSESNPKADGIPPFSENTSIAISDRLRLLHALGLLKPRPKPGATIRPSSEKEDDQPTSRKSYLESIGANFGASSSYSTNVSRWINDPAGQIALLGEANYMNIAEDIWKYFPYLRSNFEIPIIDLLKKPVYFSIGADLNCLGADMAFVKEAVVGHYKIYRPSMLAPKNHSFEGRLEISYDNETNSFSTRERYKVSDTNLEWDMPGVFFPDTRDRYLTLAVDKIDNSCQLKCFTKIIKVKAGIKSNPKQISGFTGWVADMAGGNYYTTRLYAETIDKNEVIEIRTVPNDRLPIQVREHFKRKLKSDRNEFIYED